MFQKRNSFNDLDGSCHSIRSIGGQNPPATLLGYGGHVFTGSVAAPYLMQCGIAINTLETPDWCTNGLADSVSYNLYTCYMHINFSKN